MRYPLIVPTINALPTYCGSPKSRGTQCGGYQAWREFDFSNIDMGATEILFSHFYVNITQEYIQHVICLFHLLW